jgi:hypothetical protein
MLDLLHGNLRMTASVHLRHERPTAADRFQPHPQLTAFLHQWPSLRVLWRQAASSVLAARARRGVPLRRLRHSRLRHQRLSHLLSEPLQTPRQGRVASARRARGHAMPAPSCSVSRAGCQTQHVGRAPRHLRLRGWRAADGAECRCLRARAEKRWGS